MLEILKKIVALILPIIFALFPKLTLPLRQQLEYGSVEYCEKVASIIEDKDVEALKGCMCKNIKDNYPDLSGDIKRLYDLIEGDIVDIYHLSTGTTWTMTDNDGDSFAQCGFVINITTTSNKYEVGIICEYTNTKSPEECGIRSIVLHQVRDFKELDSRYRLASICATNGIEEWHE